MTAWPRRAPTSRSWLKEHEHEEGSLEVHKSLRYFEAALEVAFVLGATPFCARRQEGEGAGTTEGDIQTSQRLLLEWIPAVVARTCRKRRDPEDTRVPGLT